MVPLDGRDARQHVVRGRPFPILHAARCVLSCFVSCCQASEHVYNAFFVDLFVRVSNTLAINMYNAFGYSVYRRVIGYYSGEEDAFGKSWVQIGVAGARYCGCSTKPYSSLLYSGSVACLFRAAYLG